VLQDLKRRLENHAPLTPPLETVGFEYGFNTDYLKKVIEFWKTKYNWREREAFLNSFPQFKTTVDGLDLHFIHVKPKNVDKNTRVLPLLLLHGWPGSVREFYDLIPLLTIPRKDMNFVFEVIAPSLPGYGFSEGASKPGLGAAEMAVVMKDLMERLGFKKFYAQGGDWGAALITNMATLFPDR
jgi:Predicted hydrolases or acyltransferases (alpha/beta hydrolase superfamily)